MAFEQSFPLFALGPRTDLNVAYLNAVVNGTTVTVNASETSAGFNLTRTGVGTYRIDFPKSRFVHIIPKFLPTAAANGLVPRLLSGIDPSPVAGQFATATLEVSATAAGAASEPAAANNEIELLFLLGF